ncbi:TPA: hypothetical protein RG810_001940, partial [Vibrio vulnificus]|nr:hypothetical protein [Vibrio vulnificus]
HYNDTSNFSKQGWPEGKQLVTVTPFDGLHLYIYHWSDGSFSSYDRQLQKFDSHYRVTDDKLELGWPHHFDPTQHEIIDVSINPGSDQNSAIYANGKMQYKVSVRVKVVDRNTYDGVNLSDHYSAINNKGLVRDLVTLYLGDKSVDTDTANIAIDGEGEYTSNSWIASRVDAGYSKDLRADGTFIAQVDGSFVEFEQEDDAAYPASAGWNVYNYWVSSTEETGLDGMDICARVGSYSADGQGYYDSCDRYEYAHITVLPPKRFSKKDYSLTIRPLGDLGMNLADHRVMSIGLKNGSVKNSWAKEFHTDNAGSACVATYNNHWNSALGQTWNNNTSLYLLPFGTDSDEGPYMYAPWGNTSPRAAVSTLPKDRINLLATGASLHVVTSGVNKGTWTNCRGGWEWTHHNYALSGKVGFEDTYGNDGTIIFTPSGWDFNFD